MAFAVDAIVQGAGFYNSKIHVLSEMNKTIACSVARAQPLDETTAEVARAAGDQRQRLRRGVHGSWPFSKHHFRLRRMPSRRSTGGR